MLRYSFTASAGRAEAPSFADRTLSPKALPEHRQSASEAHRCGRRRRPDHRPEPEHSAGLRAGLLPVLSLGQENGLTLETVRPFHVAAYIDQMPGSKPTFWNRFRAMTWPGCAIAP